MRAEPPEPRLPAQRRLIAPDHRGPSAPAQGFGPRVLIGVAAEPELLREVVKVAPGPGRSGLVVAPRLAEPSLGTR